MLQNGVGWLGLTGHAMKLGLLSTVRVEINPSWQGEIPQSVSALCSSDHILIDSSEIPSVRRRWSKERIACSPSDLTKPLQVRIRRALWSNTILPEIWLVGSGTPRVWDCSSSLAGTHFAGQVPDSIGKLSKLKPTRIVHPIHFKPRQHVPPAKSTTSVQNEIFYEHASTDKI